MTKRLKIMIGPNRDRMEIAHVNNSNKPTIIDSEFFVGRVLIKIRDFEGITADDSPPIRDHVYFDGRSRKFDIQIEGRFKRRQGVELYSGEEIHFGSDFDHIVDFSKSAFNAGMRVARWIDPNVFYDLTPPSERPFIMSPYLACMNTLCAWPCPDRLSDALVCLRQSDRGEDHIPNVEADDMVPMEQVDPDQVGATAGKKKIGRHPRLHWRFIGLKGDHGRIDAFIEKNKQLLAEPLEDHHDLSHQTGNGDLAIGLPTPSEEDEYDNTDAVSCCAPSSHATYSTALEGLTDYRPLNSASSYRFSPRQFPRHQISFGAGMRDIYHDAEIEANVREGEARATRIVEMMGEDDTMPTQRPSATPETPQPPSAPDHESDEGIKKSSSKVKHSLKKLKTAFKKMTPGLTSTSTASSSPYNGSINKRKSYSTAFMNGKPRDGTANPIPTTVSRAASRTLPTPTPTPRDSSQTLRHDARSPVRVNLLARSSSLMPRPKSHHPPSSTSPNLQHQQSKTRSTSLDQSRPTDLRIPMSSSKLTKAESNLFTIHQAPGNQTEGLSPTSEKDYSARISSPSTIHYASNHTSDTSASSVRSERGHEGIKLTAPPEPLEFTVNAPFLELDQAQATSPTAINSDTEASHETIPNQNLTPPIATTYSTLTPPGGVNTNSGAASNTSLSIAASDGTTETVSKSQTQMSLTPSQAEIDEAPELEDVEIGDLMFANMLKLAGDSSDNPDPAQGQLGPWRFKTQTTDILEDNTFVFLDKSVNVQKRRKYFSESNGKHRKEFVYDPDVVYATSFFSPFMDFNTFDLAIGPVKINVAKVFGDMPVRYTLRSTRIDESNDKKEEEIFVTISFELVDA